MSLYFLYRYFYFFIGTLIPTFVLFRPWWILGVGFCCQTYYICGSFIFNISEGQFFILTRTNAATEFFVKSEMEQNYVALKAIALYCRHKEEYLRLFYWPFYYNSYKFNVFFTNFSIFNITAIMQVLPLYLSLS